MGDKSQKRDYYSNLQGTSRYTAKVMELTDYATRLHILLRQHDAAVKQILKINEYITDISRQVYQAAMYGTVPQVMQLLSRKSVAEGVKRMYKQYRLKKWVKVQLLVHKRPSTLRQSMSDTSNTSHWSAWLEQYPDINMQGADNSVGGWAVMHCEFSRYS